MTARERLRHLDRRRHQEVAHLAVQPRRPPPRPRRPRLAVIRLQRRDVAVDVAARQRHLHDEVMQHEIVQHDDARLAHRLLVDPGVMRVVAELIDDGSWSRGDSRRGIDDRRHVDALAQAPGAASTRSARRPFASGGSGVSMREPSHSSHSSAIRCISPPSSAPAPDTPRRIRPDRRRARAARRRLRIRCAGP